jgi:hypothetical protein
MNEKIKRLIIDNVFRGIDIDFDVKKERAIVTEGELLIIKINIDSKKIYKSSGYFDKNYFKLISDLADGNIDDELFEFLPMIGYDFSALEIFYDKDDLSGYKNLFYAINDLEYKYRVIDRFYSTPWLYIEFNASDVEVDNIYYILEDEFGLSIDDVILLSRNS